MSESQYVPDYSDSPMLDDEMSLIHPWDEEEQDCPITSPDNKTHRHFMKCSRCGTRRHGAYAEQGAYHYFEHEHPDGRISGILPPCSILPEGHEQREVTCCGHCRHIIHDLKEGCTYKCDAGQFTLRGVFTIRK